MPKPDFVFLDALPLRVAEGILDEEALMFITSEPTVLGLSQARWGQVLQQFSDAVGADVLLCLAGGMNVINTAAVVGRCERQVKNVARGFLRRLQAHGLPQPQMGGLDIQQKIPHARRPSRAGRPRKGAARGPVANVPPDFWEVAQ